MAPNGGSLLWGLIFLILIYNAQGDPTTTTTTTAPTTTTTTTDTITTTDTTTTTDTSTTTDTTTTTTGINCFSLGQNINRVLAKRNPALDYYSGYYFAP